MHSQLRQYMEVLSQLHVRAALSPENKTAMCASNGRLNWPHNLMVSKKTKISSLLGMYARFLRYPPHDLVTVQPELFWLLCG
jgi:hypothetical protein